MNSSRSYCYIDPWDDTPYAPQPGPSAVGGIYSQTLGYPKEWLISPYDDDYPEPEIQPPPQRCASLPDSTPGPSAPLRKRERSATPPPDASMEAPGPSPTMSRGNRDERSRRRKRERNKRKKQEAQQKGAAASEPPFNPVLQGEQPVSHANGNNNIPNGNRGSSRALRVDDPIHVPRAPSDRIMFDPSAPLPFQMYHVVRPSYSATLCNELAHLKTSRGEDVSLSTTSPSRISLPDLQPPFSHGKRGRKRKRGHIQQMIDPPRKLVVLDLNGSLVWRSKHKSYEGARKAFRRPYVHVLAQYLAHDRTTQAMVAFPRQPGRNAVPLRWYAEEQGSLGKGGKGDPGAATILAPLDAMIWTSAQPHNVEDMVDVAFGSNQVALRAVWTRSMIGLSAAMYNQKTETVKDLRRIWWNTKNAYNIDNTALVDDSPLKARLQPHNLLPIPEYIRRQQDDDDDTDADRSLLAMIGVFEEMRSQKSVPAWIQSGGLWGPKGVLAQTSSSAVVGVVPEQSAGAEETTVPVRGDDTNGHTEADDGMDDLSVSELGDEPLAIVSVSEPQWWEDEEVIQYWADNATVVLEEMGISVTSGRLNPRSDASWAALRSKRKVKFY